MWAYFPGGNNARLHRTGQRDETRRVLEFKGGGATGLQVRLGKIVKPFGSGGCLDARVRQVRGGMGTGASLLGNSIAVDFTAGVAFVADHQAYVALTEGANGLHYLHTSNGALWKTSCGATQTVVGVMDDVLGNTYQLCVDKKIALKLSRKVHVAVNFGSGGLYQAQGSLRRATKPSHARKGYYAWRVGTGAPMINARSGPGWRGTGGCPAEGELEAQPPYGSGARRAPVRRVTTLEQANYPPGTQGYRAAQQELALAASAGEIGPSRSRHLQRRHR
jgi:hypothetical protein